MACSINDIAKQLSLSRNTVSKALNGKPGVSDNTRKMIIEKAGEMKYRQFIGDIESHAEKKKGSFVFLTKTNTYSDFWLEVIEGINEAIENTGYTLTLGIVTSEEIDQTTVPPILTQHTEDIKGIILIGICNTALCKKIIELNIPTVSIDMPYNATEDIPELDVVTMENEKNIKILVRKLIHAGKKNFAFAGDLFSNNVGDGFVRRYMAFKTTLEENGIKEMEQASLTHEQNSDFQNLNHLTAVLKGMQKLPEVYICGNDWTAIQLVHALNLCGYSIPEDIVVTGFDNIPDSANLLPSLTTIATPCHLLGKAAIACLLSKIADPGRDAIFVQVTTRLIVRESTGKL